MGSYTDTIPGTKAKLRRLILAMVRQIEMENGPDGRDSESGKDVADHVVERVNNSLPHTASLNVQEMLHLLDHSAP